ncbi:MAG: tetratricopeptide repeat protein [candidate division KSB1 bacterium]|nr:tetratricopeptide repeat protein [candidate division KSB1 bacterium]MDZ7272954.1 tetratricopeptide repeat protein [candidate division KSB1 bacterium]MDZ7285058.1 tetratricopeptide repeat protein [candidate division KSB1 bacterium]MDZ7298090.1 tetratricopeptide repeat protein [candidate division KSB1 bacterium]MDZ7309526.1 tetratricopeptide repeat protein [candidate division KSB1 bacterium]
MSNHADSKLLAGAVVVFTGKLFAFSRRQAQELVRRLGGQAPPRVTRETTMLVIGEEGYLANIVKSNKLKRAEAINASGGRIRILSEAEFLEMTGQESRAALEKKFYSLARIQRVFPRLRPDLVRYFAHWGLFTPAVKTNAEHYYEFKDLLTFRQIDELLQQKLPLRTIAQRILAGRQPSPQTVLEFEEYKPKGAVVALTPKPAVTELPRTAEDWYHLGYAADGNPETYDQAIAAYENALAMKPDFVEALINLANIHCHRRELPRAAELLERAQAVDENNHLVCYNLANLYDELGETGKALQLYQRALTLFPEYEPAIFNLAVVYEKLGMREAARMQWQRYLQLDPSGEWAAIAREHLQDSPE